MRIRKTWLAPVLTALAFGLSVSLAVAQGGGPGGGGGFGGGGPGGGGFGGPGGGFQNMDPAQMRQQMQDMQLQNYRDQLEVTSDDEWNILKDRIVKVMDAQNDVRTASGNGGRGFGGRGGGRNGGGPGGGGPGGGAGGGRGFSMGTAMPEQEALQTAFTAKASADELKSRLEKFRAARKGREDKLAAARKDLRAVLSQRQEVGLVLAGLLD